MVDQPTLQSIAILGGTGKEGKALAYRWAKAGYHVIIGSRTPNKARATAHELMNSLGSQAHLEGFSNLEAVQKADIVALTVPYTAHRETLETLKAALQGKTLIDATVPLVQPRVTMVKMPPAGSAALEARGILGEGVEVVSAFQNISHEHLLKDEPIECDVLVCGTSEEARTKVLKLVNAAGLIGWEAGPLENSVVVEGLSSVLIGINKLYGGSHAGIKITGTKKTK